MKINLGTKIRTFDGQVLMDKAADGSLRELTIKIVLIEGLLRTHPTDDRLSGEEKLKRFELARRVYQSSDYIELTNEEILTAKTSIGIKMSVLLVGQAYDILDGKNNIMDL